MAEQPPGPASPPRSTASAAGRLLGFVAPTGLLTGIFYYFGYVSARSFYGYFGIPLSALGLPASHYFIQTTDTVFRPLAIIAVIALSILVLHQLVDVRAPTLARRTARTIHRGLVMVSIVLAAVGLVGLYTGKGGALCAASLAAAAVLAEYSLWLGLRTGMLSALVATLATARAEIRRGILLAVVVVAVFWGVTDLAHDRGLERARIIESTLPFQPQAVVYSVQELSIPGTGVQMQRLPAAEGGAIYLYNGLRPLVYAHDRWFLLPKGWKRGNGDTVVLVRDTSDHVRVDLAPGK
ncbi:hypothetical protein GCM10022415_23680 [Knoellia locipacati]|uniref:Uncharacterized protein n=1 Tax=Knoellia locipacati TaxID=882824 RepID=A0A512T263_9MICO|nr:hypothetical protein [Knoellia locipacati]GEQ14317.1 hypothetical protein KLO01_23640 [Knoellia locipacati]